MLFVEAPKPSMTTHVIASVVPPPHVQAKSPPKTQYDAPWLNISPLSLGESAVCYTTTPRVMLITGGDIPMPVDEKTPAPQYTREEYLHELLSYKYSLWTPSEYGTGATRPYFEQYQHKMRNHAEPLNMQLAQRHLQVAPITSIMRCTTRVLNGRRRVVCSLLLGWRKGIFRFDGFTQSVAVVDRLVHASHRRWDTWLIYSGILLGLKNMARSAHGMQTTVHLAQWVAVQEGVTVQEAYRLLLLNELRAFAALNWVILQPGIPLVMEWYDERSGDGTMRMHRLFVAFMLCEYYFHGILPADMLQMLKDLCSENYNNIHIQYILIEIQNSVFPKTLRTSLSTMLDWMI